MFFLFFFNGEKRQRGRSSRYSRPMLANGIAIPSTGATASPSRTLSATVSGTATRTRTPTRTSSVCRWLAAQMLFIVAFSHAVTVASFSKIFRDVKQRHLVHQRSSRHFPVTTVQTHFWGERMTGAMTGKVMQMKEEFRIQATIFKRQFEISKWSKWLLLHFLWFFSSEKSLKIDHIP